LDRRPFYWVQNLAWIYIIIGLCAVSLIFVRTRHLELTERAMQWPDAIGLGIFTASGTQIALDAHMPPVVAVIMGTITAIFGGVARDIVVNEIPKAFIEHEPYAVIAFTGGWIVVIGDAFGWASFASLWVCALAIIAIRLGTMIFGWRVPAWRV
jgi:uncharacterized membrane protein YeiH